MRPCVEPLTDPGRPYFTTFVEGRRGEILDAALAVFAEKGYDGGTMREIAARVGVTEPALYRHYAGKEALLLDLVATAGRHVTSAAQSRLGVPRPEELRAALEQLLIFRRHGASDNKAVMQTLMDAAPHNEKLRTAFREAFGEPMVRNVASFIRGVDEGFGLVRTPKEFEGRVRAMMSVFIGYFMTSMFFDEPGDDDDIIDAMLAIMGWDEELTC